MAGAHLVPHPQAHGHRKAHPPPPTLALLRLKALGEGSKQWSSSAPNLGKSPKHTPMAPGFSSLNEMGKRRGCLQRGRERTVPG